MSSSTTTTTTTTAMEASNQTRKNWSEMSVFILTKYSRSHPSSSASPKLSSDPSSSQLPPPSKTTTNTNSDSQQLNITTHSQSSSSSSFGSTKWSHYHQPKLMLIVETLHSDSQSINPFGVPIFHRHQSIILKVIWDNNPTPHESIRSDPLRSTLKNLSDPIDIPGVFLLDKINLSDVQDSFGTSRLGEASLKATWRDSMVAISYATGFSAGSFNFNRMQFKFLDRTDCLKFIAILETIVACKMKGGGGVGTGNMSTNKNNNRPQLVVDPLPTTTGSTNCELPVNQMKVPQTDQLDQSHHHQMRTKTTDNKPSTTKVQEDHHPGVIHVAVDHRSRLNPQAVGDDHCTHTNALKRKSPPTPPLPSSQPESRPGPANVIPSSSSSSSSQPQQPRQQQPEEEEEFMIDDSLDDQSLRRAVRQIISQPRFSELVKRVKRLLPPQDY